MEYINPVLAIFLIIVVAVLGMVVMKKVSLKKECQFNEN